MSPIDTAASCEGCAATGVRPRGRGRRSRTAEAGARCRRGRRREQPFEVERRVGVDDDARVKLVEPDCPERGLAGLGGDVDAGERQCLPAHQLLRRWPVERAEVADRHVAGEARGGSGRRAGGGDATLGVDRPAGEDDVGRCLEIRAKRQELDTIEVDLPVDRKRPRCQHPGRMRAAGGTDARREIMVSCRERYRRSPPRSSVRDQQLHGRLRHTVLEVGGHPLNSIFFYDDVPFRAAFRRPERRSRRGRSGASGSRRSDSRRRPLAAPRGAIRAGWIRSIDRALREVEGDIEIAVVRPPQRFRSPRSANSRSASVALAPASVNCGEASDHAVSKSPARSRSPRCTSRLMASA